MTTTTQATKSAKCIAVKTPFGLMYLESSKYGGAYKVSDESEYVYREYTDFACYKHVDFIGYNSEFIETQDYLTGDFVGFLPITSNYGDQFPNG